MLIVTLSLLVFVAAFIYHSLKPHPLPDIPRNSHLPWMSGDISFIREVAERTRCPALPFDIMAETFGPISQVVLGPGRGWISKYFGFGKIMVVLSDTQEIYDILVNRAAEFDRSDLTSKLFHATVPEGMISLPTNSMFRHHKRWLVLSMTAPYLARMVPRMTECVMGMIQLWSLSSKRLKQEGSTDRAFNAMDDIRLSSIDVIASITFGASFNSIPNAIKLMESDPKATASQRPPTPALAHALEQLLETIGRNALFPIPSLLTWWTRTFDTEWHHARKVVYEFLEEKLDRAREAHESSEQYEEKRSARLADNVLDMILEKEKEDHLKGEDPLSKSAILDELATYALAGSETTATTIQWAVKILSHHPQVQYKLHEELVDKLPPPGQRTATFEELSSTERLPYLSAVVYEILRVSRTAAAAIRDATCDTTLLGHPIPKGTTVVLSLTYTQRYESASYKAISDGLDGARSDSSKKSGRRVGYWDEGDCDVFKPERWLTASGAFDPNAGPWMPFSFGFRGCFGLKLAILELRMYLALIQSSFFLDQVPEEFDSMAATETVTTHPIQCYVRPIPWEPELW